MIRYTLEHTTRTEHGDLGRTIHKVTEATMTASNSGEWVLWEDVQATIKSLEDRVPEIRIARLEEALGLVATGHCPECRQRTAGWVVPSGSFAPEMCATLREQGIDIGTGHRTFCTRKNHKAS